MAEFDVVVNDGNVVLDRAEAPVRASVGVRGGTVVAISAQPFAVERAGRVIDATDRLVVPGAVDSHFHLGIYRDLGDDAESETRSAAVGGTTTVISYFRTGSHYLNRSGPYREIFPAVLDAVRGRAHIDYAFHLVPMTAQHVEEMDWLVDEQGVTSFKFFLSYIGQGVDPESEAYDFGHLYQVMSRIAEIQRRWPGERVSLSLHCEDADLIRYFSQRRDEQAPEGLARHAYDRPSIGEGVAIFRAAYLAHRIGIPVNLLHLSGRDAVDAVRAVRSLWPGLDLRAETTPHYLTLDSEDGSVGLVGKVNPPIRGAEDRAAMWSAVGDRVIDWLASDHCCSDAALKGPDLDSAVPGFGSGALLYPAALTGARERGIPVGRVVDLVSRAPAEAYGLYPRKGRIGLGADADLVVIDTEAERTVAPEELHSHQDHSPYAGRRFTGWPVLTLQRGRVVAEDGAPVGDAQGAYLRRGR